MWHKQTQYHDLFNLNRRLDNITLYLLSDKGYLLLSWIMTMHRKATDLLFNNFITINAKEGGQLSKHLAYLRKPYKNLWKFWTMYSHDSISCDLLLVTKPFPWMIKDWYWYYHLHFEEWNIFERKNQSTSYKWTRKSRLREQKTMAPSYLFLKIN